MALEGFDLFGGGGGTSIAGTAVGGLMGAATGNPIVLAVAVAGIGLSIFGGMSEAKTQKEEAAVSADIAAQEGQLNEVRRAQATFQYQRQTIENYRNAQKAASTARAAAVNQGAQFGSGAKAGIQQATAQAAFNEQGLTGNWMYGQQTFDITNKIDQDKMKLAQLGGTAATDQGLTNIGGMLTSAAMPLGRLTGGFGAQG